MTQGEPTKGGPKAALARLESALGSDSVAALLGMSPEAFEHWGRGGSPTSEAQSGRMADLELLTVHLLEAFTPDQAKLWLYGQNAHLGACPSDVFRLEGSAPVIEAISAHQQGTPAG